MRKPFPRLEERDLVVIDVKQRCSIYPVAATSAQPKLLDINRGYRPEHRTNSWALPSLAVKAARDFFAANPRVTEFSYHHRLKPRHSQNNEGITYLIALSFFRKDTRHLTVRQYFTCHSTSPGTRKSKSSTTFATEIKFYATWLSPKGETTLTDSEADAVAASISMKGIDLLEPLEDALVALHRDLGDRVGLRYDKVADMCHDMLEMYKSQNQAWRADRVQHSVVDQSDDRYAVQTPANHLGQRYLGNIKSHRAIIALGSNIGDRVANIEESLQAMIRRGFQIRSTSFLYETKAMYYEDQDLFLNGVCEIEIPLEPLDLLDNLQQIESELGRVKLIDKGPRSIDLDILLYDFDTVQHPRLQIPHKLMLEREFVLRPLADIIPGERLPPPHNKSSIVAYLEKVETLSASERPSVVSNFGSRLPLARPTDQIRKTRIMAVLNITPDSFSDGGKHNAGQLNAVEAEVRRFIAEGASIIDVGGQSTRPGATRISWQEELERVRPVIERIRSMPEARNIAISIDTFYADVARGAVAAGADIINDVSGGLLDSQMLPLIADLQVTVVIMHMRGTPENMKDLTNYPDGVVEGVAKELLERVEDAQRAGIPRWRIVLDPGIGFAKTQAQNLELLRSLETLRQYPGLQKFPWLVGTSRKGFIGKITGISDAPERGWGTAATVTSSVASGADIVRVHDVSEMTQVVKMADAMYRVKQETHITSPAADLPTEANADASAGIDIAFLPSSSYFEREREGLTLSEHFYAALEASHREFRSTKLDSRGSKRSKSSDYKDSPPHSSSPDDGSRHFYGLNRESLEARAHAEATWPSISPSKMASRAYRGGQLE